MKTPEKQTDRDGGFASGVLLGANVKTKKSMTKEKYWAVKIGDPRKHHPYFMLADFLTDDTIPALFNKRESAEQAAIKRVSPKTTCKVVRVELRETRST